jgi:hypothetical protein
VAAGDFLHLGVHPGCEDILDRHSRSSFIGTAACRRAVTEQRAPIRAGDEEDQGRDARAVSGGVPRRGRTGNSLFLAERRAIHQHTEIRPAFSGYRAKAEKNGREIGLLQPSERVENRGEIFLFQTLISH